MRTLIIPVLILSFSVTSVAAGPNAGGVLVVHSSPSFNCSTSLCECIETPASCEELDPQLHEAEYDPGVYYCLVLAAFPEGGSPGFQSVAFGLGEFNGTDYDGAYIGYYGHCDVNNPIQEWPSPGWPQSNAGTRVVWLEDCPSGNLVPVYWFVFYLYTEDPMLVPLGPHPTEPSVFLSCDDPPEADPIEAFGAIGVLREGFNFCNGVTGVPEDDGARLSTWGRIKAVYR